MVKRKSLMILLILVLSITLYGCKGNMKNTKTVTVGITQDLDSLDPHKAVAAGTKEVLFNIYEGLYKLDKNGELVPAVAESYEVSSDNLVYTFNIREGIKFHNGNDVTANDIEYSVKRSAGMLKPSDPMIAVISALSVISDVKVIGNNTVSIVLSEPDTEILYYLSTCDIIPKDYAEISTKPIGTGPFRFVSYSPLENIVMVKYDDYYLENKQQIEKLIFKISSDTDAAFMELRSGVIDILPYLTDAQAEQIPEGYYVKEGSMNLIQGIFLNNEVEPFNDIRVRQALSYAIDRQKIIDIVAGGKGEVLGTNMFPGFKNYYDETLVDVYDFNPEKAKELLRQAGYDNGISFTIKVPSNYQYHVDTAQIVVEQLRESGINADIRLIEWSAWLSEVYKERDYQATLSGLAADVAPRKALERFDSEAGNNFMNYKNPEFDKLYAIANKTNDETERISYYKQMQAMLTNDAVAVYIQNPFQITAINNKLEGYTYYPIYVQDMSLIYYK